ncbi:MAG TPA: glycerol-3-phosphate responsive antiterminator [Firmicutes bacterium]|nr:glycerol-3-phosphate responsive antiterminator [Bacillota bacterium]
MYKPAQEMPLLEKLARNPIIAGIRDPNTARLAIDRGMQVFFILGGTLLELGPMVSAIKDVPDCLVFLHIDLVSGVGKDAAGVEYLAKTMPLDGIVTTRNYLIRAAKDAGLLAVQRLFALDSEGVKTGLTMIQSAQPDAVEILPALVLPHLADRLPLDEMPPIIAGGLVETWADVEAVLRGPAVGISTSRVELWDPHRSQRRGEA